MGFSPIPGRFQIDLDKITDNATRIKVNDLQTEREQLERNFQSARGEADAAKAKTVTLDKANAELRTQLDSRAVDLNARDSEIATLKANEATGRQAAVERDSLNLKVAGLTETLKARDAVIAKHLAEIADLRANPSTGAVGGTLLPIASVATNVAAQVSTAQTAIRAAGGFTLANVSVRLKGVAEGDAGKIRILGASELRNPNLAGALDELNFDFAAPSGPTTVPADKVAVPSVLGLTQLAAQRALAATGLRLDPATGKAPASARVAPGQAFKQSPDPAALADRGVAVLVVFAQ